MSTPDKPDHARGWKYVERLLGEEEDERIKNLSDDALRAELRQGAKDPEIEWSADELLARAESEAAKKPRPAVGTGAARGTPLPAPGHPPQKIAPVLPIRRTWRTVGLFAAACVALFLFVKLTTGPDVVTLAPSNRELAEAHRNIAAETCARKDWVACKANLDEAANLDPAGDSEPRVQKARQQIAAGMAQHSP